MSRPESCGFLSNALGEEDGGKTLRIEQDVTILLGQFRIPASERMD